MNLMDDLISRQEAIDAVKKMCDECDSSWCGDCRVSDADGAVFAILRSLPSKQPPLQVEYAKAVRTSKKGSTG